MKSYGNLWRRIVAEENLYEAWENFRKNHARKRPTLRFGASLDENIARLGAQLRDGTWQPSGYHQFKVSEPKPRIISCVPVPDRVVHHAIVNVCAPLMERRFIVRSFACRKGYGSHFACLSARRMSRRWPYFAKLDVRKYFENIDHEILMGVFARMFRERELVDVVRRIVEKPIPNIVASGGDGTRGLPIGNLTSQWLANLYLDGFDHYAAEELRLGARYMRYMDDILVFAATPEEAWAAHDAMRDWLWSKRRLELKEEATRVCPVKCGVPFLGLIIRPDGWRLKPSRLRRTWRSARMHYEAFRRGEIGEAQLQSVLRSMNGAAEWYGFKGLYARVDRRYFDIFGNLRSPEGDALSGTGNRVIRGGNYNNAAGNCSSSYRNNNSASNANANYGVRLCSVFQGDGAAEGPCGAERPHSGKPEPGLESVRRAAAGPDMPDDAGAVGPAAQVPAASFHLF